MQSKDSKEIIEKLKSNTPTHVVGIGASAGALGALKQFFQNLPPCDNVAFIVVQHLSPDFDTVMDELLEKHCALPIKLAEDCQEVQANHVYLLPERTHLSVASNKILLSKMDNSAVQHSIDYFFRSLAEEYQNYAIAVVLSGTGDDGSKSLKDLHKTGALILVQDPKSAEFDGMPKNAIKTGYVDHIVNVEEMGAIIAEHIKSAKQRLPNNQTKQDDSTYIEKLHTLFQDVKDSCQINLGNYKQTTIERRIHHRMGILSLKTIDDYMTYLKEDENEKGRLVEDISIGVTHFFRDPKVWKITRQKVFERMILETAPEESIRVWVPGCSTGEEAYTISILFEEAMEKLDETRNVRIFASDIDRAAIRFAGLGVYSPSISHDIPEKLLKKYFVKLDQGYLTSDRIRKRVVFAAHNLIEDPPFSNMNFVSCRNLLIYFHATAQKNILSFIHFALKPDGFLLLGESESTSNLPDYFVLVEHNANLFKREKNSRVSLSSVGLDERLDRHKKSLQTLKQTNMNPRVYDGTIPRIKEKLFNSFVPPSVVLDSEHNLVYSFGDTDLYTRKLQPGSYSTHYGNLLHASLVSVVSSLLKQLTTTRKRILLTDVSLPESNEEVSIEASFVPLSEGVFTGHFIISFINQPQSQEKVQQDFSDSQSNKSPYQTNLRIRQLDEELVDVRVLLGEKQQDVEALTEELQATNEELMASNEELQSTNEELQSVNEELFTVNTEYQSKIEELLQANKDLDSLLNATEVGVVYLDKHFLIRRFTPKSCDYVNLLPLDTNRPFTDIALNFDVQNLEAVLSDVRRLQVQKHIVIKKHKKRDTRILLTITPYLDVEKNFEGIILVFQDILAIDLIARKKES